jgi:hypothetical protein
MIELLIIGSLAFYVRLLLWCVLLQFVYEKDCVNDCENNCLANGISTIDFRCVTPLYVQ